MNGGYGVTPLDPAEAGRINGKSQAMNVQKGKGARATSPVLA